MTDITPRMNRLFNPTSGRCLDVAVDHGFFGEHAFLGGLIRADANGESAVSTSG